MAILRLAEAHAAHEFVWMLARSAWRIWFMAAEYDDLIEAHQSGLAAARSAGDEYAIAVMTNYLSSGLYRVGRVREAADMLMTAHGAFLKLDDRTAANIVLSNVAVVRLALGEIDAAEASAEEALIHARRSDDLGLIGTQLNSLGSVQNRRGNLERSLDLHRRELLVAVEIKSDSMRYLALGNVAITRMRLGHRPPSGCCGWRSRSTHGSAARPASPRPPVPSACSGAGRAGSPKRSSITGRRWTSRIPFRTAG